MTDAEQGQLMTWTVADMPSQHGKTAVVTGTGGLGFEVALALARAGARVILAGRNRKKGEESLNRIRSAAPSAAVEFAPLDLASLSSVMEFAEAMKARETSLDLLINNAGIMSPPQRRTTEDGFELQFGVNHLAHFALTLHLMPLLATSGTARVVNVTSLAQHQGRIVFDDLQSEQRYKPGIAYCQSKLAQANFTVELQRRSDARGLKINSASAHPGFATTSLFENGSGKGSAADFISKYIAGPLLGQPASQGALPLLYAATSPQVDGGAIYGPTGRFGMKGPPGPAKYARAALDPETGDRLWRESERLTGLSF